MGGGAWRVQHLLSLQPSIKSQALANFLMKCILPKEVKIEVEIKAPITLSDVWMLYIDGASNAGGSRVGLILASSDGIIVEQAL